MNLLINDDFFVNLCKLLEKVCASYVAHGFQNADVHLVQDEEDLLRRELGKVCEEYDEVEDEEQYDDNFVEEQEDYLSLGPQTHDW